MVAHAGIRGPGKYCGVVIFDRWDTCFLLSGPYITYISESVKEPLRPYKGKAMEVDASEVFQLENPGDALIRKYKIDGPAPDTQRWTILDGIDIIARSDFSPQGSAAFVVEIRNDGTESVNVDSRSAAPALLAPISQVRFAVSDGASAAAITRGTLLEPSSWESSVDGVTISYSYAIDDQTRLPERFQLEPGRSIESRIAYKIPPGKYQFLFGYGGGVHEEKSLASNAISFDLDDDGIATVSN
jgi:hypothetical protein